LLLSELLKVTDKDAEVVVTDCLKLHIRTQAADVPDELRFRGVDFIACSDLGGLHLRIVLDDPALYHDTF